MGGAEPWVRGCLTLTPHLLPVLSSCPAPPPFSGPALAMGLLPLAFSCSTNHSFFAAGGSVISTFLPHGFRWWPCLILSPAPSSGGLSPGHRAARKAHLPVSPLVIDRRGVLEKSRDRFFWSLNDTCSCLWTRRHCSQDEPCALGDCASGPYGCRNLTCIP